MLCGSKLVPRSLLWCAAGGEELAPATETHNSVSDCPRIHSRSLQESYTTGSGSRLLCSGDTGTLESGASAVLQTTEIWMRVLDPNDEMSPVDGSGEGLTVEMLLAVRSAHSIELHKPVCPHMTLVCSNPPSL